MLNHFSDVKLTMST